MAMMCLLLGSLDANNMGVVFFVGYQGEVSEIGHEKARRIVVLRAVVVGVLLVEPLFGAEINLDSFFRRLMRDDDFILHEL